MYNTALTINLQHIHSAVSCTDVVFGPWEHLMPSHNVCSVPAWPSPPHPFITRQELINEADFQRSSTAQTVQLCIFGIFLYHVLVAWWARQSSHMWEARGGNEPRGMSYICLSHDLCHCCKLKRSDWCATVNLHSPRHADAGRTPFTSRVNQDARLEEERRQQAHAVNSKGAVYNMTQTSVLIRHSCSQKRLVIVWLLLQTHRATFIFYIGAHNLLYSGLFSGYNSWRVMCRLPQREKQSCLSTWRVGVLYLPEKRSNSIPEK